MELTHISLGERTIALSIRRHMKARRISLRLSPARDSVVMTLPKRSSVEAGIAFFKSKSDWVLENVETDLPVSLKGGEVLPILGKDYTVRHMQGRGVTTLTDGELLVYGDAAFTPRRVRDFLTKLLRHECTLRSEAMATSISKEIKDVKIRNTRSRWGSCTATGHLTFSLQLAFAPLEILDYVIAHEVAHLMEMNHGPKFWSHVATLCPTYKHARTWIRQEGHRLHRYG